MRLGKVLVILSVAYSIVLAVPTAKEKFDSADVNNDNVLTLEEFYSDQATKMEKKIKEGKSLKGVSTAPEFEKVDGNGDGKVTFAEYDVFHTARQKDMEIIKNETLGNSKGAEVFEKYDLNKNGSIEKNEFKVLYEKYIK